MTVDDFLEPLSARDLIFAAIRGGDWLAKHEQPHG